MSGLAHSIGKVFKKVGKAIKTVAPYVLAAAAVVFTGGAALGLTPALGTAIGGAVGELGLSTTLSNVLGGALTQAAYGSAIGGASALVAGGDPKKGMAIGALGGAATGGVSGAFGVGPSLQPKAPAPPPLTPAPLTPVARAPLTPGAPQATAGGPFAKGGLFGEGGWLERNNQFAGTFAGSLAKTAGAAIAEGDDDSQWVEYDRQRGERYRDNYGAAGLRPSSLQPAPPQPLAAIQPLTAPPAPAPAADGYDAVIQGSGVYRFNPHTGRIEFVRRTA